jgi:hypothetical protein
VTGDLLPFPGTTPAARRHAAALERFGLPWVDLEPAERLEVYRMLDAEV